MYVVKLGLKQNTQLLTWLQKSLGQRSEILVHETAVGLPRRSIQEKCSGEVFRGSVMGIILYGEGHWVGHSFGDAKNLDDNTHPYRNHRLNPRFPVIENRRSHRL